MNAHARDPNMTFAPGSDNTQDLRAAFARFATGVTVVTCASEKGPVAITANSFSSISLDPPLVMWAAARDSRRYPAFVGARKYAIHILSWEQQSLCELFARDGFGLARVEHRFNDDDVPLIDGCLARFECRQTALQDAGDHVIILGEVEQAEVRSGDALAFYGGQFVRLPQS